MEYTKRQIFEKLWEMLKALNNEELSVLYKSEFYRGYNNFRQIKMIDSKLYYADSNIEVSSVDLMQFMVKCLNKKNQNHKLVLVFNSIQDKEKIQYLQTGFFKLESN